METLRYAIIMLLLSMRSAYAMDLVAISNVCSDRFCFFNKPIVVKKTYVDMLPPELQGIIVKKLLSLIIHENEDSKQWIDQERLEKHSLKIELFPGVYCVNKFRRMQNDCNYPIADKKILMKDLFFLQRNEQEAFGRMADHPLLLEGNIFPGDFAIVQNMSNKNVQAGLNLRVNYLDNDLCYVWIKNVSLSVMGFSIFCLPGVMLLDRFIPGIYRISSIIIVSSFFSYLFTSAVLLWRYGFRPNYIKNVSF